MNTRPNDEVERLEAVNCQLAQNILDLEAEIERKNKALEGFIAENEALKAELGGMATKDMGGREKENGSVASSLPPKNSEGKEQRRMIQLVRRER
jgi:hypothetical protein